MARDIALVLADVDGTLVTQEKVLTEQAKEAVRALHDAGIEHADLNLKNILIAADAGGAQVRALVIDLDG
ncbi:MAG: lipopolysaccharide kinase InaA family protein, partial [Acetobacteraceae bacterium]